MGFPLKGVLCRISIRKRNPSFIAYELCYWTMLKMLLTNLLPPCILRLACNNWKPGNVSGYEVGGGTGGLSGGRSYNMSSFYLNGSGNDISFVQSDKTSSFRFNHSWKVLESRVWKIWKSRLIRYSSRLNVLDLVFDFDNFYLINWGGFDSMDQRENVRLWKRNQKSFPMNDITVLLWNHI